MNYQGTSFWAPSQTSSYWDSGAFLVHYGILGMRWGVRRYQNRDGSLTAAGRIRKNIEDKKNRKVERDKWRKINKMSPEDREKAIAEEHSKYVEDIKSRKNEFLKKAKENDSYILDYLEIRPDSVAEGNLKTRLADYEKFLDDPDGYIEKRHN